MMTGDGNQMTPVISRPCSRPLYVSLMRTRHLHIKLLHQICSDGDPLNFYGSALPSKLGIGVANVQ